ncbi:MAG: nucleotidyltransferase [Sporocytophaga sp.]|uniref:nucleotidyltransferase n=1 Tax=Sporocytophaga sp. TaxID=2231183 RepID=UPI001B2B6D94|nr:nucleotidyltransferase [Sporocytophaga sp.]MBO9702413.1 nucleotidyltransferase [Sporocytophaga sp.]
MILKKEAHEFFRSVLEFVTENNLPILVGGAVALRNYTGIVREKDLDLFCKPGDYIKILKLLSSHGWTIEITDARWIAKALKDNYFVDFIFNTTNNLCPVDDSWFEHSVPGELYGVKVKYVAPEELMWSKIYIQDRAHYDGSDVNHLILKKSDNIDWKRVLQRLDQHWHLLLGQLLNFQFIYPSERDKIPRWLFEMLLERAKGQYELPAPVEKVCRGPLVDHSSYSIDIVDWHYKIITVKSI